MQFPKSVTKTCCIRWPHVIADVMNTYGIRKICYLQIVFSTINYQILAYNPWKWACALAVYVACRADKIMYHSSAMRKKMISFYLVRRKLPALPLEKMPIFNHK